MLNIKILCIGKIKEKALKELTQEYIKRLSKYCKLEIVELNDEKLPFSYSDKEAEKIKEIECKKIAEKLERIGKCSVFCLDLNGQEYSSENFSKLISTTATYETSTIVFVIGGSLGLTNKLLNTYKNKICFSKMTFPHQMIRLFLLEQIFRAFKIQNNETYHH